MPLLQPSSADLTLAALVQISAQLGNLSATSTKPFVQHDFTVSGSAVIVNGLFFTSLSLILFAAFLAMLIRGWLREFDRGLRAITIPEIQAKEREKRLQSLERYHVTALVALLPVLVQLALVLFCVGLVLFLLPIYAPIAYVALSVFSVPVALYIISGVISLLDPFAPFSSPFTRKLSSFGQLYRTAALETIDRPRGIKELFDCCLRLSLHTAKIPIHGFAREHVQAARLYGERQRRMEYNMAHPWVVERLVGSTVKAPESLAVFLSAFEQSQHPHLRPQPCIGWRAIIECVQPLLGDGAPLPLSVARGIFRVLNYQLRAPHSPLFDGFNPDIKLATLVCRRLVSGDARGVDRALVHLLHSHLSGLSIVPSTWHWSRACERIPDLEPDDDENGANLLWAIEFACRCHSFTCFRRQMGREQAIRQSLRLIRSILLFISKMKPRHPVRRQLGISALKAVILLARAYIDGSTSPQGNDEHTSRLYHCIQDYETHKAVIEDLMALFSPPKRVNSKHSTLRGFAIPCLLLLDCVTEGGQSSSHESAIDQLLGVMVNEGTVPPWMAEEMRQNVMPWGRNIALWTASLAGLTEAHAAHPSRLIQWTTRLALGRYHLPDGETPISLLRTFIATYDERTRRNLVLMDTPALEYITSMVKYSRKKYNIDLSEFARGVSLRNPWLLLHFDNLLGRPTTLEKEVIEEMKWVSTSAFDLIAQQRIALYISTSVSPEPLIHLFLNSSSFSVQLLLLIFTLRWSRAELGNGQNNLFGSEESPEVAIHSLLTRLAPAGFLARDKDEYARFILDWILIAEDLYPHWSSLPDSWRKALATGLVLGKNSLQWFRGVSELYMVHLDARCLGAISRHDAALHSETSLKGSLSSFVDLHSPIDMLGEQTILLEKVAGEMEKKRLRDAAAQLLPFLADAIEEISTKLTPIEVWAMNENIYSLLRLPSLFGDAICRSRINDILEEVKQREVEIPLKLRRVVPGSVESLEPRWWIEPSPPPAQVSSLAPSQVGGPPDPPDLPNVATSSEPIPANVLQIEP
jgi:hypothetical protein